VVSTGTRIQHLFERLSAEKRAALICYLTAGDPSPAATPGLVAALERGGAALIELGIPFSDPIADGPVIQRGAERALRAGTSVRAVLEVARKIRETSQIPLLLFTYLNPVLRYGLDRLAHDARLAGIDGVLLIDLSVEEAQHYVDVMRAESLDAVFLAAPTSSHTRLKLAARYSTGFVYLVSRMGVTGVRDSLSDSVAPLVAAMRAETKAPLAVGFGISTPEQARAIAQLADGVVIGSAVVRLMEEHGADLPRLECELETFARRIREAMEQQ
jgi:tryptophan synthase alpha chain